MQKSAIHRPKHPRAFNTWPTTLFGRMFALYACWLGFALCLGLSMANLYKLWPLALVCLALGIVGLVDLKQTSQSIRRNYPILAHLRFFLEFIRPEIRQYFFESNTDAEPFSRNQRSLVYQRAKAVMDKKAFGTQVNVYASGAEWLNHSTAPHEIENHDFRISIGGPQCKQPYLSSIFNISAMSFGALSARAILALNKGAKMGNFAHDTGEGSISKYHREHQGDIIWEIGSGYFGCRTPEGRFDASLFRAQATNPQVKMIEIKLSQGAKPGHGGVLPGSKVTPEIAEARGVMVGQDCISPASHSAFSTPTELMQFIDTLRTLSDGKPVGIKLCIGHPWEWFSIAKAMMRTGIRPDFIVIDGSEGGTGAAPVEFTDHVGSPLTEGLRLVHNTLVGLNIREDIRLIASGKIISAFDIARTCALGADLCNSARGFMFALGCIMAQTCHTGNCPTGVTTQDQNRQKALDPDNKADRVYNFHENTLKALAELLGAAGITHPKEIETHHISRRMSDQSVSMLSEIYPSVEPGALLLEGKRPNKLFEQYWDIASESSFKTNLGKGLGGFKAGATS